jgi:tol-pal system protein YbgF
MGAAHRQGLAIALCTAIGATLAATALLPSSASAQLFSDDQARRAILDVRGRVDELQRDLGRRLDTLELRIERIEQTSRGQLENQAEIQQLRQEIASLRGQVEVLVHELTRTQRGQRDLAANLDSRLKRFEPIAVTIDGKEYNVDINERRAFEGAMALFRSGDFKGAGTALQQFLGAYPQSAYRPGALYWLGSSQYAAKDLRNAAQTLRNFVNANPEHPMVPDALLTLGNALADAGENRSAADVYERILTLHDGTPAAEAARDRLQAVQKPAAGAATGAASGAAPAAPASPAAPAGAAPPRNTGTPQKPR